MIIKINLRDQIRDYLLHEMAAGKVVPGSSLSLAEISRNLDVSVTPIREALNQLERAGIVSVIPNRGFLLSPLSLQEALELYPVISQLESLAIENSIFSDSDLEKLKLKNEKFKKAKNKRDLVLSDDQLHLLFIQNYNNRTLQRIVSDLKIRVLYYELEYQNDLKLVTQSGKDHDKIIKALENGKMKDAATMVKDHWIHSMRFIQKNLTEKT